MQSCIGARQPGRSLLYVLAGTWSPRGAHGYVIGVAIGVRCELKVKLGYAKAAAGTIKLRKAGPAAFPGAWTAGLKVQSCMIRLDIQLV